MLFILFYFHCQPLPFPFPFQLNFMFIMLYIFRDVCVFTCCCKVPGILQWLQLCCWSRVEEHVMKMQRHYLNISILYHQSLWRHIHTLTFCFVKNVFFSFSICFNFRFIFISFFFCSALTDHRSKSWHFNRICLNSVNNSDWHRNS